MAIDVGVRTLLAATLFAVSASAQSQYFNPARSQAPGEWRNPAGVSPEQLEGVGIEQKLDARIDLNLEFRDSSGDAVILRELFRGRPVALALVYYECPMLCTLELNGLMKAMRAMDIEAGKDYDVVTVSFDPRDTPELAARKKDEYLRQYLHAGFYDRDRLNDGWRFLVGEEASSRALAEAVGYGYRFDEERDIYRHASGLVVLTPEGRVSRYLFGVEYSPRDLKFALMEAADSKIGTPLDAVMLYCFHYDPVSGKYGFAVMNALRLAGGATLVLLGGFVLWSLARERARAGGRGRPRQATG